jgi:hypothetical protein
MPPLRNKVFVETSTVRTIRYLLLINCAATHLFKVYPTTTGELDQLVSGVEHAHFVASPYVCRAHLKIHLKWLFLRFGSVFGAPPAADKKQLLIVLAGEYKIKKEIAPIVVPAIGRKVWRLKRSFLPVETTRFDTDYRHGRECGKR